MTQLEFRKAEFDPDTVFGCGQTFRFARNENGVWSGIAYGCPVHAYTDGDRVLLRAYGDKEDALWRRYTDADRDYSTLFEEPDDVLKAAVEHGGGLRVLQQEPFEILISMIISANNNIPRISGIIERICALTGDEIGVGQKSFPGPEALLVLTEADLRSIGAGYRAPYIVESARRALDTDFSELAKKPYEEVHKELLKFAGVGPKVADCIALFALGKTEAFPVDVWIRRILKQLYGVDAGPAKLRDFAARKFGKAAGIAQQYLFHYARENLERGS